MIKKDPHYRVTVFTQEKTIEIRYPITCKFNVQRGLMSNATRGYIQLFNLDLSTRNEIYQDLYIDSLDRSKWKFVRLEAGYGGVDNMSKIFEGRIQQAYSYKSGPVDIITDIQVIPYDIFDCQTSQTFAAGTLFKDAYQTMANNMPNVVIGNTGALEGQFLTPTSFDGNAFNEINKLTGGHTFVDNGVLNTVMDNEVIDVPVPVITDENGLLGTPMRRGANLDVQMLFEPSLIIAQLLEIKSAVSPNFNGQYKVIGFNHNCLISKTQAGNRITTANLWIGPLLPGADINLTNNQTQGGFNKVKGSEISTVLINQPSAVREVYQYIQRTGRAPHTKITNNIYWDEVVKNPSLSYEKPSLQVLSNLYQAAQRLQIFIDSYFPGMRITPTSGWRSRKYNATLRGADPNSEHIYGNAIDFTPTNKTLGAVWSAFNKYWRGRKKAYWSSNFIHCDTTIARGVYANDW